MWYSDITYPVIAIYVLICALVGTIGMGRQIGFWLTFIVSIFTTPIIGLIVAALSSKQTVDVNVKKEPHQTYDVSDELIKLHGLIEKGIITEEEFQKRKNIILNKQ
jgi:uncharacterized membrane protein